MRPAVHRSIVVVDIEGFTMAVAGVAVGFAGWIVVTALRALSTAVDPAESVSPDALLRTDRAAALRQGFLVGSGGSLVLWTVLAVAVESAIGIPFGRLFPPSAWLIGTAFLAACAVPIWVLSVTVWGPWLIARSWLALTGRLPRPVMAFLRDAHRRGVLRQAGGLYQFRHARLQNRLADADRAIPAA